MMSSFIRVYGKFTVVFYILFPLLAITTLYTILFRLDPPHSLDLGLPSIWNTPPPRPGSLANIAFPSLRHLCDKTVWTEGLWLQCHNNAGPSKTSIKGGLSNIRNRLQTCVRLAISAGAGIIVILHTLILSTMSNVKCSIINAT
jgi:hypothetical protein